MAWRSSSSDERVTVALLLERQVELDWHEAVAIVLEAAEVMERSGKRAVPVQRNVVLTPAGSVEFLSGRTESGDPVTALAQLLNALLPKDRPTQLRLIISTAGPDGSSYKSVGEFAEALKYFERPGRLNLLAEVHARARQAPAATAEVKPETKEEKPASSKRPNRLRRLLVPVTAVLLLVVAVAAGVAYFEQRDPGSVSGRAGTLQDLASDAWTPRWESGSRSGTARRMTWRRCSSGCAASLRTAKKRKMRPPRPLPR